MDAEAGGERRGRRAPRAEERRRDPERTRRRILDAAAAEFARKGYDAARVADIAGRAGVNKQLISYYFDGKAGLMRALQRQWEEMEDDGRRPDRSLAELAADYALANWEHRDMARVRLWSALAGGGGSEERALDDLADMERRKRDGEVPEDIDPRHLLLALFGAASAVHVAPELVRALFGAEHDAEQVNRDYAVQLSRIVAHLTASDRPPGP